MIQLVVPACLLIFGIYHGLIQTLYRAGLIRASSFAGIEYYQGLTAHGVINAIVFTTFFAVAFGTAVVAYFLGREPNRVVSWIAGLLMLLGSVAAAATIFAGKASVLYTFYAPLKAHAAFYAGAAALIVGSWIAFFSWIPVYLRWRREHPAEKTPMAVVGMFTTFIVWLLATVPLAYSVLFQLLPWSLGYIETINIPLSRTLFWFFGHPLVYFWLLPAYTMYYTMLPKLADGRLYSDFAGRLAFMLFIVFSAPVGVHHQFGEPGIGAQWKGVHAALTYAVGLPSFLTAFTLAASMEYGARKKGGQGLFDWWGKLPYFDPERPLFAYFFAGMLLFLVGGITGILNTSYSVNAVVHNTSWVPGHFHTTVGGPVFLAFIGMTIHLISKISGKRIASPKLHVSVPWLWLLGVSIFSTMMMLAGLQGEPRRTNLGMSYSNPDSPMFSQSWSPLGVFASFGALIMFIAMVCWFIVFFQTLAAKRTETPGLDFPVSEPYLDENVPWVRNFRPWVLIAIAVAILAYAPPLYDAFRSAYSGSVPFSPDTPIPLR
jgi:cytochrome c oxidase subunit 1